MSDIDLSRYPCPVEECDFFLEMTVPMYLDVWADEDGAAHFTFAGSDTPTFFSCGGKKRMGCWTSPRFS